MRPTDDHGSFAEWFAQLCTSSGLTESSHHGQVDFRAGGKIIANVEASGAVTLKLPLDEQQALLHEHRAVVELPAGWSRHGWTTIQLAALDHTHVAELLATAIETVTGPRRS